MGCGASTDHSQSQDRDVTLRRRPSSSRYDDRHHERRRSYVKSKADQAITVSPFHLSVMNHRYMQSLRAEATLHVVPASTKTTSARVTDIVAASVAPALGDICASPVDDNLDTVILGKAAQHANPSVEVQKSMNRNRRRPAQIHIGGLSLNETEFKQPQPTDLNQHHHQQPSMFPTPTTPCSPLFPDVHQEVVATDPAMVDVKVHAIKAQMKRVPIRPNSQVALMVHASGPSTPMKVPHTKSLALPLKKRFRRASVPEDDVVELVEKHDATAVTFDTDANDDAQTECDSSDEFVNMDGLEQYDIDFNATLSREAIRVAA